MRPPPRPSVRTCAARCGSPRCRCSPPATAGNLAAREAAIAAARQTGSENYDETWLANDLDALDSTHLREYLAPLATGLDPQGKETFVQQVARIGLADGPLTPPETQILESLSSALGLSAAHLRGIVVSTPTGPGITSTGDGDEHHLG